MKSSNKVKNKVKNTGQSKRQTTSFRTPECDVENVYTPYMVDYQPLDTSQLSELDCDLSQIGHEDALICELVLWLHECEKNMGIDPQTMLVSHDTKEFWSTVGIIPTYPLHIWIIQDAKLAVSYHPEGPYAILPYGYSILAIRRDHSPDIFIVRYM